jgi:outer membrane beta-barrel protein
MQETEKNPTKQASKSPGPSPTLLEAFSERFNKRQRIWAIRLGVMLLGICWLLLMAATWSRAADAAELDSSPQSSDQYNFKWLDPDKKIYVLQNRRYQKEGRVTLSLGGGPDFSNAYRTSWSITPRLSYFFSEQFGVEFFFTKTGNTPNNTYNALVAAENSSANTVLPVVREIESQYGGVFYWSPWYAKINVFNAILYFDWMFGAGISGMGSNLITSGVNAQGKNYTTTTTQNLTAPLWTTGQQFYLSDHFIARWDLTGSYYSAPIYGTSGSSSFFSDYSIELGIGVRL